MPAELPPLIASLLDPARYPDPAERVELVETHASWLLLAGDYAYKVKKPLTLPFLDYGTLDKRRACCEAELQLNRRFAADLYLGVVPITGQADDPRIGGSGPAIEFAVRMRRFVEAGRADRLCARRQLRREQVSQLAQTIADFHEQARQAPIGSPWGDPGQVLAPVSENFDELRDLLAEPDEQRRLARLDEWTNAESGRLQAVFAERKATGRIRECHGDLHLGNIVLVDGRFMLFDCIEFNEALRWIDVASEIAFTYVDLLDHDQPGFACWLLNEWLASSGDYPAARVLRFYAVYRALVRAKVAAIRSTQRADDAAIARQYLALAERLVAPPSPQLIITHGVAGCGKSRASRRLLLTDQAAATIRLRSDVERKRLFGLSAASGSGSPINGGIYAPEASELTYRRLRGLAAELLDAKWSVIVDAAFLERSRRDDFRALASETGVAFRIVAPQATRAQLRARVQGRLARRRDASEATLAVLERQLAHVERLSADERSCLIDPSRPPDVPRGE
ncbi:bifunctional aminoglycoside phosphotransferase/ATP-binding protein [Accumulibacter sp.]|uniref:bifunctional aminoglycoside phosphotransferase/ATP-binding protein n=1 Tax=Accumulibacter sp. TaxID=2053492 RepID=UPI0025F9C795|nr:bifunctional aminoglycoside phosphotransferase/ATP-binding protein [Accumulibacter sp.]MCM8596265.1 AAA family ATPase [Accumulibacter sp.]MCM8627196.1 AAA family ATPase [Accumulibacter sp.]MDS4050414.1 AAA family ATPase [Accumulibacter sp.]